MKAIVTRLMPDKRREKVLVDNWPEPQIGRPNQFKTRTLYSGVTNGTERNDLLRGNYAHADEQLPMGWGYQNVGRVVEVGPEVRRVKVGDLLYMSYDHTQTAVMPDDGLFCVLPPAVDPIHATLFGMSSVAMRSCRHADLKMGHRLLVVGAGFIGQVATQIANVMGARVTLCDVDEGRLDLARKIGAAEGYVNTSGDGWTKHVEDGAYHAVLDVAGVVGMEDRLLRAAASRGTVLFIAGRFKLEYTFNLGQMREITIKQNSHFDNDDLANVCRLVARGMLCIGPLIQDVVPVSEAKRIYDTLRDEPNKLRGTVFDWTQ
jgi:2-desacetyl-2-hydroxyethyl bacteriochlorophyllide A dehydrogenase